jgi:hypothetical protein
MTTLKDATPFEFVQSYQDTAAFKYADILVKAIHDRTSDLAYVASRTT